MDEGSLKLLKDKIKTEDWKNTTSEETGYENSPYKKRENRTTLPNVSKIPTKTISHSSNNHNNDEGNYAIKFNQSNTAIIIIKEELLLG